MELYRNDDNKHSGKYIRVTLTQITYIYNIEYFTIQCNCRRKSAL